MMIATAARPPIIPTNNATEAEWDNFPIRNVLAFSATVIFPCAPVPIGLLASDCSSRWLTATTLLADLESGPTAAMRGLVWPEPSTEDASASREEKTVRLSSSGGIVEGAVR